MAKQATSSSPDVTKVLEQFKVPGIDIAAMVQARRKEIEALTKANKEALEAVEAFALKQSEAFAQALQGIESAMKAKAADANANLAKHTEAVRAAFDKTLADMNDLAQITKRAQTDALEKLTARGAQQLDEIKKALQPK